MKQNIRIHVPQSEDVSYSLYARGFMVSKPEYSVDESEIVFTFSGEKAVVLFYTFLFFRRAFIITGWEEGDGKKKSKLIGVEGDIHIIATLVGKRIDIMNRILKKHSEEDEYRLFRFPVLFWYRLAAVIDRKKVSGCMVENLIEKYMEEEDGRKNEDVICSGRAS